MPTVLWKKQEKRACAQKLIDLLLPVALGRTLSWQTEIAFAELVSSAESGLSKMSAELVLQEMHRQQKRTADDFELIYEQLVSEWTASQIRDWRFFIPLEMTLNTDVKLPAEITMLDSRLSFLPVASVKLQLDKDTNDALEDIGLLQQKTERKIEHVPQTFLSVTSSATNLLRAWKGVEPAFDTLRGLIVLLANRGNMRIVDDSSRPRGQLPHPTWMIVQTPDGKVEWVSFQSDEFYPNHLIDLTDGSLAAIKTSFAIFERKPTTDSTISVLSDCLRLYAQAMDAKYDNDSFLAFWQLIEVITRSEAFRGDTDKVVARIAWHGTRVGLSGSGFKETLKVFSRKRNGIVHRGISAVTYEDVNIIKFICETAILWLFSVYQRLPTSNHLEHFYQYREKSDAILDAVRDSAAYVIESRKPDSK